MRAAIWTAEGTLVIEDRPVPEPRPGWVRVKVAAVGICGSDLHLARGAFGPTPGLLPGHEVGGVVDAVGDGVDFEPGTPVAVEPILGCGKCRHCLSGSYNRCDRRMLLGMTGRGGMADFMTAPASGIYPLPPGLNPADGALAEPVAVCVRAIRLAGMQLGDRVAVIGGGTIGLISALCARRAGASEVIVVARHPSQQQLAGAFGADRVFGSSAEASAVLGGEGIDLVVETVGGTSNAIGESVDLVDSGGTIVMLGVFEGEVALPGLEFSRKEIRLVGSNCYSRVGDATDFSVAIGVLSEERDRLRTLVTHSFPLERVSDAFDVAADKSTGSIKVRVEV